MKISLCTLFCLSILSSSLSSSAQSNKDRELNIYSGETEIKAYGSVTLKPGFYVPQGSSLRIFIDAIPSETFAGQPSASQNYVNTRIFKTPGVTEDNLDIPRTTNDVNQTVQYFDGLGRPLQTVQTQASPGFKDLVQPVVYDAFGREALKYQPYAAQSGSKGSYRASGLTEVGTFYNNPGEGILATAYPVSETVFEASPLNRVLQQGSPGADWQVAAGHTQKTEYGSNLDNTVRLWTVTAEGASGTSYYSAGMLYLTVSRDENTAATVKAGSTEEYKDLEGRVVLKRIWETEIKSLSTYYVYDDLGNLRYVLPPAVNLNGPAELSSFTESQDSFNQYIYGYHYDGRQRLIEKKIPGTVGWTEMIYNPLNQLVFSQDPLERAAQRRSFIKYDGLGRVVMSGQEKASSLDRNTIQGVVNNWPEQWERRDNTNNFYAYSNGSVPSNVVNIDVEVVNYYDDYDIPNLPDNLSDNYSHQTRGLLTASLTRVLGTTDFLWTVNYYDDKGRLASQYRQHYLKGAVDAGNYDRIVNTYNFGDELTASTRQHYSTTGGLTTIANRYRYDHVGRKLQSFEKINANEEVLLVENSYNELGQLKTKGLHNKEQQTSYTYNERGWLKGTRSAQFSQDLNYQSGATPQFNGNISEQYWGAGAGLNNSFSYTYDKLNRLTSGVSTTMSEVISYDVMGNIKSLNRDGTARAYGYIGNQLQSVTGMNTYAYDANGNATTDGRSGNVISYNRLNLPSGVAALKLSYIYDATGKKLKKKSGTDVTDYIDGIQYTNGALELIQTEAGIARKNVLVYSYEYNLTDHLGNVRYTFYKNPESKSIERLQSDDYYPFGLRKLVQEGRNKYLYNGKELQDELGQYDYGARFYDPVIGRFNTIDPLSEVARRWSPFSYGANNPIRFVDVDGMYVDEPTPEEAALISGHVYGSNKDNIQLKGGWAVSQRNVGLKSSDFTNSNTGLKSALYERTVDGITEYVYATAGTEVPDIQNTQDITANGAQLFGNSAQYDKSLDNAKTIRANLGNSELTYVGHSLGGGEASVNSIATGDKAITFNAAGISIATKMKYGGFTAAFRSFSNQITAYQLKSDPLTIFQDMTFAPSAIGSVKMISPKGTEAKINGHSILSVINSIR